MPEASANVDDPPQAGQDDVRLAREVRRVQAVPEAHPVDKPANGEFRKSVPALNAAHIARAPRRRQVVQLPLLIVQHSGGLFAVLRE